MASADYLTGWQRLYPFEAASEGETERLQDTANRLITIKDRIVFFMVRV
jgi:hypothetical protein